MNYYHGKSLVDGEIVEYTVCADYADDALYKMAQAYARSVARSSRFKWLAAKGAVRRFLKGVYGLTMAGDPSTAKFHNDLQTFDCVPSIRAQREECRAAEDS